MLNLWICNLCKYKRKRKPRPNNTQDLIPLDVNATIIERNTQIPLSYHSPSLRPKASSAAIYPHEDLQLLERVMQIYFKITKRVKARIKQQKNYLRRNRSAREKREVDKTKCDSCKFHKNGKLYRLVKSTCKHSEYYV